MQLVRLIIIFILVTVLAAMYPAAQASVLFPSHPLTIQSPQGPTLKDQQLKAEVVYKGIRFPTTMAFLGPKDILVLEKNDGNVQRIINGTLLPHPILHVNVAYQGKRGLLGIAVAKHSNGTSYVFLYYTEAGENRTGSDVNGGHLNYLLINNKTRPYIIFFIFQRGLGFCMSTNVRDMMCSRKRTGPWGSPPP